MMLSRQAAGGLPAQFCRRCGARVACWGAALAETIWETMGRSIPYQFTCACGTEFTTTVYEAVNVTLEPQLLYTLLVGLLNVATCPNCGRRAAVARPFLYHDVARGLFAYVHPRADLPEERRAQLLAQLRRAYSIAVEESARLQEQPPASDADAGV